MAETTTPDAALTVAPDDAGAALDRLRAIMARLRDPVSGCPWDQKQTYETIAPYTIEEAYEVADAIARSDMEDLTDELGDLLLQVVYHARIAEERGDFRFSDVANAVSEKMLRRHPHVFAGAESFDWEAIKAEERAEKAQRRAARAAAQGSAERPLNDPVDGGARPEAPDALGSLAPPAPLGARPPSALDGVAVGLPALTRAVKLQARAAKVGFDWPDAVHVLEKVSEEARELVEAAAEADPTRRRDQIEDEYGDLLFVMANLARHLGVDPETALRRTNEKFRRRFHAVETEIAAEGTALQDAGLDRMEAAWRAAKRRERSAPEGDTDRE